MRVVHYAADGWGVGVLWLDDEERPVWHELPTLSREATVQGTVPLTRLFQAYFAGERVSFDDVAVDLEWCTPLQRTIAESLRKVPYGETVSYGELAALAGRPNAPRAGGTFCANNRLPLIFPCHRVVAAGGIGGYGSLGVEYKRRLLELEGAAL
jgi:methylated-DNA-[protein]-cysteine S-methyltransferase